MAFYRRFIAFWDETIAHNMTTKAWWDDDDQDEKELNFIKVKLSSFILVGSFFSVHFDEKIASSLYLQGRVLFVLFIERRRQKRKKFLIAKNKFRRLPSLL